MSKMMVNARKNVTFSGTDTLAFIILPNTAPIVLGSLTTFSYSSYRAKKPVSTLGSVLSRGVAKGGRIIAGTLVFTLINQHWVNELIDMVPWLREKTNGVVYSDELPIFDIMLISANEYGRYVNMRVQGVNLTDEASVLSVNDIYSETTFSFIAREIRTFNDKQNITMEDISYKSNKLFTGFATTTFTPTDNIYGTYNRKLKPEYTFFDKVYNTINKLTPNEFDKIVNNMVELGYYFDNVTNNSVEIINAIISISNNLYNYDIDIVFFINNVLPYLESEFYESNKIFTASGDGLTSHNGYITSFTDKDMSDISMTIPYGENVVIIGKKSLVIDEETGEDRYIYFTDKGWILELDIKENENIEYSNILGPGTTNMDIGIFVGETYYDDIDVIEFSGSVYDILNDLKIEITPKDEMIHIVKNIYYENSISNSKEIIINGKTVIDFTEFISDEIEEASQFKLIIKEVDYEGFFCIDAKRV